MAKLAIILSSVTVVNLVAFVSIIFVGPKEAFLKRILMTLVGFASGSLIGGAFIHLLPEAVEKMVKAYSTEQLLESSFSLSLRSSYIGIATKKHARFTCLCTLI
jgi:hypothetical protein